MGGALFGILFLELLLAHAADKFSVVDGSIVSISAGQAGYLVRLLLSVARLIQGAAAVGWMAHWLACCLLACLAWPGLPAGVRTTQGVIWGHFWKTNRRAGFLMIEGETWGWGTDRLDQPAGPTCKKFCEK